MRIGYPCINLDLECRSSRTFRLASWSEERFCETVEGNLECLGRILEFNRIHGLLFFRISSDLVPFASHPVCAVDWRRRFRRAFGRLGDFIRSRGMRVSMHPDQFTVINALDGGVVERSVAELVYHVRVLDALGLDETHKVQIHVGGAYGDKAAGMARFTAGYGKLPRAVRRRLVIENDDRLFSLADCMAIHRETGVPVVFDNLHHELNGGGMDFKRALAAFAGSWGERDGLPMADYSSQAEGARPGAHTGQIDTEHFRAYLRAAAAYDFDIMCEIKDKQRSALAALEIAREMAGGRLALV